MLTRDQILEAQDLVTESVDCPEWGGAVLVRVMSGTQRDAYEAASVRQVGGKIEADLSNLRAKLVVATVVDEAGNRLFSDKDVGMLGMKSATALDRVAAVARRLNGLSGEAVDTAGKNSAGASSAVSTSGSPSLSVAPSENFSPESIPPN